MTATSFATPTTATAPLSDLELRIDPERTLDLFTMLPKVCMESLLPVNLTLRRNANYR